MAELMQDVVNQAGIGDSIPDGLTSLNTHAATLRDKNKALSMKSAATAEQMQGARVDQDKALQERAQERKASLEREAAAKPPGVKLEQERLEDYKRPQLEKQDFNESFSILMAMSMLVGAASRTPFYGAMNAMTGAMNGFVKGDQQVVKESMDAFDKNFKVVTERNAARRAEYNDVWNRYKNDLNELKRQTELLTYKWDDVLLQHKLKIEGIGQVWQAIAKEQHDTGQALNQVETKIASIQQAAETARLREETRRDQNSAMNSMRETTQDERERHNRELERLTGRRLDIQESAADAKARAKAEGGGLKGPQLTHYISNESNIEGLRNVLKELDKNPEAVGFKTLMPNIILNRYDEQGIPIRASLANIVNASIKTLSGATVTANEWKRIGKGVPQDGDSYEATKEKVEAMIKWAELENQKILKHGAGGGPAGGSGSPSLRIAPGEQNRRNGDAVRIKQAELAEVERDLAGMNVPDEDRRRMVSVRDALRRELGPAANAQFAPKPKIEGKTPGGAPFTIN